MKNPLKKNRTFEESRRCIQNPCKHLRWSFLVNILNDFIFSQLGSITDLRLGYILASEKIEIFKVKLRWSKSSRLLQRIAFLVFILYEDIKKTLHITSSTIVERGDCKRIQNNTEWGRILIIWVRLVKLPKKFSS